MDDLKADYVELVKFVKPSSNNKDDTNYKAAVTTRPLNELSGSDAVLFYKDVISRSSNSVQGNDASGQLPYNQQTKKHHGGIPKLDSTHTQTQKFNVNVLLHSSQNGDLTLVKKCLANGVAVDSQDRFGWTPLMCAACSGHRAVVNYLLDSGANTQLTASDGKSASCIARNANQTTITQMIEDYEQNRPGVKTRASFVTNKQFENFYCDICKRQIKETTRKHHQASTVHLFNRKMKAKPHSFLSHSQNKGYQIMRKTGWDGEKGLGSKGQGQKFPVKTVLKRDRACLGSDSCKMKAKVTHFGPKDTKAVTQSSKVSVRKMSVKALSKRAQKAKDKKQKLWEKNLRWQFNSD